jgi:hypothetical protein
MNKLKEKIWQDLSKMFIKHQKVDGIRMALQTEVADYIEKNLQSYSLEMDEVIGEDFNGKEYPYGEDGWQDDGEDTTTYAQDCINEVKASQRQEKLEIDKKWGIK